MPLNPLAPVTDYQSMLNRIFWFTSASAVTALWLLRAHVPPLDAALRDIDFAMGLRGDKMLPTPGGTLMPALAFAIATRVFRLHARISDWLGIRECFDVDVILGDMAEELSIEVDSLGAEQLRTSRQCLMRKAFYPYVSSSRPTIDEFLVQQALDAWSWFWIGVESTFVFTLTAFALIACDSTRLGVQLFAGTMAFAALGLPALRRQCQRYAAAQVRAILADPARAAAVRAAFMEVVGGRETRRAAA